MGCDSVLLDLKILNGDLSLEFDKYVNNYTVSVASDVDKLEIDYKIRDTDEIKIVNNENLEYGLNYIFIEVTNEEEKNMYTLEVYREKVENVMSYENVSVPKTEEKMPLHVPYLIGGGCFVVILFFFMVIFGHRKSKR